MVHPRAAQVVYIADGAIAEMIREKRRGRFLFVSANVASSVGSKSGGLNPRGASAPYTLHPQKPCAGR